MEKIILNEETVLKLMEYIINNKIVNVNYFLNVDLNSNGLRFKKKMEQIKKKYPEIYLDYEKKYNNNYNEFKEELKIIMLYILMLKKYGIELEDGSYRKFDIFDFYNLKNKYFNNFYKKELFSVLEELSRENVIMFSNLNVNELRLLINSVETFCPSNYEVFDLPMSKYLILITEDELTIEEKNTLINFMETNKIPFTLGNYNYGLKKMLKQRDTNNDIFNLNLHIDNIKKKER